MIKEAMRDFVVLVILFREILKLKIKLKIKNLKNLLETTSMST